MSTPPVVVDMSIGDPGYGPCPEVRAAVVRATARDTGRYAPMGGLTKLRAALAEHLHEHNGIPANAAEVVVTSGASLGLFSALAVLCRPGDRVLVPDPGFPLYRLAAATLDLQAVRYPLTGDGHGPDWETLEELAPGARVVLWNYPSNPLGAVARPEWISRLLALLDATPGLDVVSDEVYEDLCLDGEQHLSPAARAGNAADLADRIVSVFSFSKGHGMAGWRVGYLHARDDVAGRIGRAHWGAAMSTSTVAQLAALAALQAPASHLEERRGFLRANRDLAVARLRSAAFRCDPPAAGFFVWAGIGVWGLPAGEFAARCAAEAGVLLSPGTDFAVAGRDRVRINVALPAEKLAAGLERLCEWVATLPETNQVGETLEQAAS